MRDYLRHASIALLSIPLVVVTLLIEEVADRETFHWDASVGALTHGLQSPLNDLAFSVVSMLGGGPGLLLLVVPLMTLFFLQGRFANAIFLPTAVLGARAVEIVVKTSLQRPRPPNPSLESLLSLKEVSAGILIVALLCGVALWRKRGTAGAFRFARAFLVVVAVTVSLTVIRAQSGPVHLQSFPSGHATSSMALAVAVCLLNWPLRIRWLVIGLAAAYAVAVGLSRVYFGLHYPSDVIAGWCIGFLWVVFIWPLKRSWDRPRVSPGRKLASDTP